MLGDVPADRLREFRGDSHTQVWSAAGFDRLEIGLLSNLTEVGRAAREDIEAGTDRAVAPALAVLGDDLDDLLRTIGPWGRAIRDAGGHLTPLVRFTFDDAP